MKLQILVVGITCLSMDELKRLKALLKDEYDLKRLPSSDTYLLVLIPDGMEEEILEELDELNFSNPAHEIIIREINSQAELEALPHQLYFEER